MKYKEHESGPDLSIIIDSWSKCLVNMFPSLVYLCPLDASHRQHQGSPLLERCLNSLIQNTDEISYEVVIIDNNSTSKDKERFRLLKQEFSGYMNFTWVENNQNIGSLANNQALSYCHGRFLLMLDPCVIVLPQSLKKMVEFLENNKDAGAVTAKLLDPDGLAQNCYYKFWNLSMFFFSTLIGQLIDKIFFKGKFGRYYFGKDIVPNTATIVEQPVGACFMLRRDLVATDYLIDESFPFYFGDVELCKRIQNNGYKIFLLPAAEVIYFCSSPFRRAESGWKGKEYRSSAIKYFKKHYKNKVIFLKLIFLLDDVWKYIYKKLFASWIDNLKRELLDCITVLDLGCGYNSPIQYCKYTFSVGVELFEPYLQESRKKGIHDQYIKADIREVEFGPKTFDAILCSEVLEHFTREEGYTLLSKMERWARKKVVITTPNGYLWQNSYDNNPLQEHKSGYNVEELEKLGFKVFGMNGWKKLRGYDGSVKYKPALLWNVIANLTQKITYRHPKLAFQLFAVKEIGGYKR